MSDKKKNTEFYRKLRSLLAHFTPYSIIFIAWFSFLATFLSLYEDKNENYGKYGLVYSLDRNFKDFAYVLFPGNLNAQESFRLLLWAFLGLILVIIVTIVICSKYQKQKRKARLNAVPPTFDVKKLTQDQLRDIRDYYMISKGQATKSFVLTILMCVLGFILVGIAVCCAIFLEGNLAAALIPAVGSAIVELIAGTTLFVYKRTLTQLNLYYDSQVQDQRFLLALQAAEQLPGEKQAEVRQAIIMKYVKANSSEDISDDENSKLTKYKVRATKKHK